MNGCLKVNYLNHLYRTFKFATLKFAARLSILLGIWCRSKQPHFETCCYSKKCQTSKKLVNGKLLNWLHNVSLKNGKTICKYTFEYLTSSDGSPLYQHELPVEHELRTISSTTSVNQCEKIGRKNVIYAH